MLFPLHLTRLSSLTLKLYYMCHTQQIGYPAPPRQSLLSSPSTTHRHVVVDGIARSGVSNVDLRFQSIDAQLRDGSYPLHIACMSNNPATVSVIQMLLDGAADVVSWTNKYSETPLHLALSAGICDDGIKSLLECDTSNKSLSIQEEQQGNLPLHLATQYGYSMSIVEEMINRYPESRAVENKQGKTPCLV